MSDWLVAFFGPLSPFQIVVSAVALLTGAYTFYKSFIETARLELYPADSVRLVTSPDGRASGLHVICNLVNKSAKTGVLHRLEAIVVAPSGTEQRLAWLLFYRYREGGDSFEKETDPYPLAVGPRDSRLLFVEFQPIAAVAPKEWVEGEYKISLIGWVNRRNRRSRSNLLSEFHVTVDGDAARRMAKPASGLPRVQPVAVREWTIQR